MKILSSVDQSHCHFTINTTMISIPKNASLWLADGKLESYPKIEGAKVALSAQEFEKLSKAFHRLNKPSRSPHLIWALTLLLVAAMAFFSVIILGMSVLPEDIAKAQGNAIIENVPPVEKPDLNSNPSFKFSSQG